MSTDFGSDPIVHFYKQLLGGATFEDYHGHAEVALIRDPFSHAFARERDPHYAEAQVHTKCVEVEAWLLVTRHEVFLLESRETPKQRAYRERAVSQTNPSSVCMSLVVHVDYRVCVHAATRRGRQGGGRLVGPVLHVNPQRSGRRRARRQVRGHLPAQARRGEPHGLWLPAAVPARGV